MNTPSKPVSSHRISELDALRGLAAIGVLIYHFTTRFEEMFGRSQPVYANIPWGEHRVALFFMLSGYVIFMTLERTRSVGEFVVGRFSRLYPAFWASVIMTFLVVRMFGLPGQEATVRELGYNFTMMPRLWRALMVDGAYWSLEFELWFYGAMIVLYSLGAFRHIVKVLTCWLVLALVSNWFFLYGDEGSFFVQFMGKLKALTSLQYIHLFAIGMVFYDVRRTGNWTRGHVWVLAMCAVIVFWILPVVVATIVCVLAAILYAATTGRLPFLNARPLLWFGFISYPLYLIHQNIGYVLLRWFDGNGWNPNLGVLAASLLSIALASLITYTIERPVMQFIRGMMKRKSQVQPVAVTT